METIDIKLKDLEAEVTILQNKVSVLPSKHSIYEGFKRQLGEGQSKLASLAQIRKIIITSHALLDNAIEALNAGADAYVKKPFDPQQLLKVIE